MGNLNRIPGGLFLRKTANSIVNPEPVVVAKDFHPGHFLALAGSAVNGYTSYASAMTLVNDTTALSGLSLRYEWSVLEPTKDNYDFSLILAHAAELAALGNKVGRLSVLLRMKTASQAIDAVPAYMKTADYDYGQFSWLSGNTPGVGGQNVKWWSPAVRARAQALATAMGEALDGIANIELIGITETAPGNPEAGQGYSDTGFINGLGDFNEMLVEALPHKIVRQMVNYKGSQIQVLCPRLVAMKGAMSWPNTMDDEPGFESHQGYPGSYTYFRTATTIARIAEVQVPDYIYSNMTFDDPVMTGGYSPTIAQIADFAKTNFNVTHMIWTRTREIAPATGNEILDDLVAWLGEAPQLAAGGGLNTTLPSAYA